MYVVYNNAWKFWWYNVYAYFWLFSDSKMCDKVVEQDSRMLKFVSSYFEAPEICKKDLSKWLFAINKIMFLNSIKLNKCVKNLHKKTCNAAIFS